MSPKTLAVRCDGCGGSWGPQAMAGHMQRLGEAQAATEAQEAEQAARAELHKPKPGESQRDRQLATQAMNDRLAQLGLAPTQPNGLGRVLSDAELARRGDHRPVPTPEQAEKRRRQDERLRAAGLVNGLLSYPIAGG